MMVKTLFLVDNNLLNRISNKKLFEKTKKFKVSGDFSNAGDCIKALKKDLPDIILMDLELPGLNGFEACKIIKKKYPDIKIVILTTFEDEFKILAALSAGANGYAAKEQNNLEKIVDIILQGGFWVDSEIALKAFSKIFIPDIKNLEKLYKYDKLKHSLTQREFEVLKLMSEGKTNSQIAQEIIVSTNTIKAHVGNILQKFEATDRVQAAVIAVRANIL